MTLARIFDDGDDFDMAPPDIAAGGEVASHVDTQPRLPLCDQFPGGLMQKGLVPFVHDRRAFGPVAAVTYGEHDGAMTDITDAPAHRRRHPAGGRGGRIWRYFCSAHAHRGHAGGTGGLAKRPDGFRCRIPHLGVRAGKNHLINGLIGADAQR